jgi:dienelactone hydrolase
MQRILKQVWNTLRIFVLVAFIATPVRSQDSAIVSRTMVLFSGDSISLEVAYSVRRAAASIMILPDRYGVQVSTRQLMQSFAKAGFHCYTMPLNSVVRSSDLEVDVHIDSTDVERILQAVVEIRNDPRTTGMLGLIGFDAGATIGMMAQARFPAFKACALFYPSHKHVVLEALRSIEVPIEMNLGKLDEQYPETELPSLKRSFGAKMNRILFRYYKETGSMFANPGHPGFNEESLQYALNKTAAFFRNELR